MSRYKVQGAYVNARNIHTIKIWIPWAMSLPISTYLASRNSLLQEKCAQLLVKDEQIRSYTFQVEALKLQIFKLRQMQFGKRSEKRAREIEQLELWVEQLEEAATQRSSALAEHAGFSPAASIPKPRRAFPAHLARETQTIAPLQSCCPDCMQSPQAIRRQCFPL